MKYVECSFCHRLISANNIQKHLLRHERNPESFKQMQSVNHTELTCIYCGKNNKNKNALAQHECRCPKNPNRIKPNTIAKSHPAWNKGLTKDTDERLAKQGKTYSENCKAGLHKDRRGSNNSSSRQEVRDKISATCLEKSKQGKWHKSIAKNLHYNYNGIDLDGSWELAYAKWLDANNIKWLRPSIRFEYTYDNEVHYYTPDFYLVDTDEYIEIKGYKTKKDSAKWKCFPADKTLKVLFEKDLKELNII